eukprot:8874094-Pyramimonas_sp.AAC.1
MEVDESDEQLFEDAADQVRAAKEKAVQAEGEADVAARAALQEARKKFSLRSRQQLPDVRSG